MPLGREYRIDTVLGTAKDGEFIWTASWRDHSPSVGYVGHGYDFEACFPDFQEALLEIGKMIEQEWRSNGT